MVVHDIIVRKGMTLKLTKKRNKRLRKSFIKYLSLLTCFILITLMYMMTHELGHVLAIILTGNEFRGFGYEPNTISLYSRMHVTHDIHSDRIIIISGSLLAILVALFMMNLSCKHENIIVFHSSYSYIAGECIYWMTSPCLKIGDAFSFLTTFDNNYFVATCVFVVPLIVMVIVLLRGFNLFWKLIDKKARRY